MAWERAKGRARSFRPAVGVALLVLGVLLVGSRPERTAGQAGPIIAHLIATPATVTAGGEVIFNYVAIPPVGFVISPTLDFGDGTPAFRPANNVTGPIFGEVGHRYAAPGTYTAMWRVRDLTGIEAVAVVTVTVNRARPILDTVGPVGDGVLAPVEPVDPCGPPTATLSVSPSSVALLQPVTFTFAAMTGAGCPTGTAPPSLGIDFGDGARRLLDQTSGTIAHVYTTSGTYTVTLSAVSGVRRLVQGGQDTAVTTTVTVGQTSTTPTATPTAAPTAAPTATATATPTAAPGGRTISVLAGWNLIGGPAGTVVTGTTEPMYTFGPGDTAYQVVPAGTPLQAGRGYWALFPAATSFNLPAAAAQTVTVQAPAGQFIMVGNPGVFPASIAGASTAFSFNTATSMYMTTAAMLPGQGAWAFSATGGTITIRNIVPMP